MKLFVELKLKICFYAKDKVTESRIKNDDKTKQTFVVFSMVGAILV